MIGSEPAGHEWIDDAAAFVLGQVDVIGDPRDAAEQRVPSGDLLAFPDEWADVPVLEGAPSPDVTRSTRSRRP